MRNRCLHDSKFIPIYFSPFFKIFTYFCKKREIQSASGGGAKREETQNPKQASGSGLSAQSPNAELELTNREIMTSAEVRCLTD